MVAWAFIGPDTVRFVMDPTRARVVLARHAGIDEKTGQLAVGGDGGPRQMVISSDFYSVYTSAGKKADGLVNLFLPGSYQAVLRPGRGRQPRPADVLDATVAGADQDAVCRARGADDRLGAGRGPRAGPGRGGGRPAEDARAAWDAAIGAIDAARTKEMAAPGLQEPTNKALATLDREWDGLIAHRDYPVIGLDNNTAERAIRGPVVARKNAGGSRNEDAARLAATFWTVTATAQMAGLNVLTYLTAYLNACSRNSGQPPAGPELDRFLPWKASPEDRHAWAQPPPPG